MSDGKPMDLGNGRNLDHADGRAAGSRVGGGEEHAVAMDLPHVSAKAAVAIGVVMLLLLGGVFLLAWGPHSHKIAAANADAAEASSSKPAVDIIAPKPSKQDEVLLLPADVRPNQVTAIFARTSGYLKPLPPRIDIGAHVDAGQVIAEIAAPELDAQLEQAKAALEQSKVAAVRAEQEYALNQSTLTRYEAALRDHAVADQDVEERRTQQSVGASALKEAQANAIAADAAVKRLAELQGFEKVIAPFSGVLTTPAYHAGALITASDSTGKELFRLGQTDVLRVSASIPQGYATDVKLGQAAELLVGNYAGRPFAGTVARSAGAINAATRMMSVEVDVPNHDGLLLPGMYGQVQFHIHRDNPPVRVPTSALVFGSEGMRVVVIEGGRAHYRPITLGRDFGIEVEVVAGISATDQLVNNPGEVKDGAEVTIRTH